MKDARVKKRIKELNDIFAELPDKKKVLLRNTIETVAFMDIQLVELENIIGGGESTTPEKQLYASMVKTRDILMKRLLSELPEEDDETIDPLEEFSKRFE